jgi:hypothetical protein
MKTLPGFENSSRRIQPRGGQGDLAPCSDAVTSAPPPHAESRKSARPGTSISPWFSFPAHQTGRAPTRAFGFLTDLTICARKIAPRKDAGRQVAEHDSVRVRGRAQRTAPIMGPRFRDSQRCIDGLPANERHQSGWLGILRRGSFVEAQSAALDALGSQVTFARRGLTTKS